MDAEFEVHTWNLVDKVIEDSVIECNHNLLHGTLAHVVLHSIGLYTLSSTLWIKQSFARTQIHKNELYNTTLYSFQT